MNIITIIVAVVWGNFIYDLIKFIFMMKLGQKSNNKSRRDDDDDERRF